MISAVYGWLKSSGLELAANAFVAAIMVLVARRLTLWLWSLLECWIQFKAHQRSLEIAKNVFLAEESSNGNNRWMWWWYRLFPKNALQNNQQQADAAEALIRAATALRGLLEFRIKHGFKRDEIEEKARRNYENALQEFFAVPFGPDSSAYVKKIASGPQREIMELEGQLMRRRDTRDEGGADR